MKWIKVEDQMPRAAEDILFTDGKEIYKGILETYEFGEDPVFFNEADNWRDDSWPEDITHWMPLPKLPT